MREYGHQFSKSTETQEIEIVRIHSHNINNMPQYTTTIKNQSIISELKKRTADIHIWQEIGVCWPKVDSNDNWRSRTRHDSSF